ncbi:MAG: glycosyltransferase family 39 protein [bacterium]
MVGLAAVTFLALVLRLLTWRMQGTGWLDELFSLRFASGPLFESLSIVVRDTHPPLYHLLLSGWLRTFGDSLASGRALSVLCGTAAVPAVWLAARELGGRRAATVAAVLAGLSPVLAFHSGEARMYPLLAFLSSLSLWLFARAWRDGFGCRAAVAWGFASAAMLLTHVTAAVPFAAAVGWGAWRSSGRGARRRLLLSSALSALPFAVWLASAAAYRWGEVGGSWQLGANGGVAGVIGVFPRLIANGAPSSLLWPAGLMMLALAAMAGLSRHGSGRLPELYALWAVAPSVAFLPLGWNAVKYYLVALPAVSALMAAGLFWFLDLVGAKRRRTAVAIALACLYAVTVVPALCRLVSVRRIRWDEAARFVESRERPGDLIFAEWFVSELPLREHYRGSLPVASGYGYDESLPFDERLVRYSGAAVANDEMLSRMARDVSDAERVFLVTGALCPDRNPVQAWFVDHGWRLEGSWSANEFSPTMLLFGRR